METHNRRSIRLKGYDYSQSGLYFITICCHNRQYRFGEIQNGKMILNDNGKIAVSEWEKLNERFYGIKQGAFVVMPNHIHFIIIITQSVVWAGLAPVPISTDNPVGATLAVARLNPTVVRINPMVAQLNPMVARINPTVAQLNPMVARMDETDRNEMNDRETVMAGFTPARDNTDETSHNETETDDRTRNEKGDREGRPNQYNGIGNDGDREGRPNEPDETNEPVGAGLAPAQNETGNIAEYKTGNIAEYKTGNIARNETVDINQYKTVVHENETVDREGRPNQYNGIGNEVDREGRPNGNNGIGNEGDRKGRPNDTDRKIALGEIVGAYKSLVFNNCLKLAKEKGEYLGKFWQRDYFENII